MGPVVLFTQEDVMVTIRLARHGLKSVRSTRLLSLTAVMHATALHRARWFLQPNR